ncbi:hypothetical protein K42PH8_LOCUS11 [Klebsiella phage vB_Kpn_K42PH8]|uniref:Uncharacterized protein n=1 Tax=Klebsiella phage vB_Kpn_K42PH8 TaxID=3071665 RepID=A0AAV1MJ82_9CAUD|nr:hypothetical protein K42PH8_LOCUS11 [Klebsiella phage vB_Kpn_K42PH8]
MQYEMGERLERKVQEVSSHLNNESAKVILLADRPSLLVDRCAG